MHVVGVAVALAAEHVQTVVVQHTRVEVSALGWRALDCDHLPLEFFCAARSVSRDSRALARCQVRAQQSILPRQMSALHSANIENILLLLTKIIYKQVIVEFASFITSAKDVHFVSVNYR